jgi:stress response protein YsnF
VATTETRAGTWLEPVEAGAAGLAASQTVADITLEVPLYAEALTATITAREAGGARLEKDVVSEEATLDVPVTEERVKVVRGTVNRPVADADTDAFEEAILDVSLEVEEASICVW